MMDQQQPYRTTSSQPTERNLLLSQIHSSALEVQEKYETFLKAGRCRLLDGKILLSSFLILVAKSHSYDNHMSTTVTRRTVKTGSRTVKAF